MPKNYLASRQNVVALPIDEINAKLAAIEIAFGEAWLSQAGAHPVRDLWNRPDALATNELLNLGDAIERFSANSPAWLLGQVSKMKDGDAGEVAGAIFEVLALNLFPTEACRVQPAPESTPGFDGTLFLGDGSRILLSIKNHGMSQPERQFLNEAIRVDEAFKTALSVQALRDVELNVIAKTPLSVGDFHRLRADVETCLADAKSGGTGRHLDRPYQIIMRGMAGQHGSLSAHVMSSTCRIMAPMAQNEQKNFDDAIRKGCANLAKHTVGEADGACRMILLRLSNSASIAKCREWAEWFFTEWPNEPIDLIVLYQCMVTVDEGADTSSITHHLTTITGPCFPLWQKRQDGSVRRLPGMSILVGVVSEPPPTMQLKGDGLSTIDLSSHYMYQRSDVYKPIEVVEGASGVLSNPAPGIVIHATLEKEGVPLRVLSPVMARDKQLLLLP